MTDTKSKAMTGGIILAVIAVLIALGFVLPAIFSGLKKISEDAERAAGALTGAAADTIESNAEVASSFTGLSGSNRNYTDNFSDNPTRPTLILSVKDKKDSNKGIMKTTSGVFVVKDGAGNPVQNAKIAPTRTYSLVGAISVTSLKFFTDKNGLAKFTYEVIDEPFTHAEDDVQWTATKSGYNASGTILTL